MNQPYLETVRLVERLHRHFLDVLRVELRRLSIEDINAVQAMLLCNIGEKEVAVRDLKRHGYYLGSNVTYNLKSLTDCGYLEQERSSHDRRSVRLRLTDKGLSLSKAITQLQNDLSERMEDTGSADLVSTNGVLTRLERTWTDFILSGSWAALGFACCTEVVPCYLPVREAECSLLPCRSVWFVRMVGGGDSCKL